MFLINAFWLQFHLKHIFQIKKGNPLVDIKQNGFTAAGPVYTSMYPYYISTCIKNSLPMVVTIDLRFIDFLTKFNFVSVNKTLVEHEVESQVKKALDVNTIVFGWYILPDELRPWRANEMEFLNIVTSTIRKLDQHPIIAYSPNNRDALMLKTMGENGLDYLGKQAYVVFEQNENRTIIIDALKSASDSFDMLSADKKTSENSLVGVYLELAVDPQSPSDDYLIPTLARHDVFLSVAHGAKFILIWSLFRRVSVYRTYTLQYKGYVDAVKEINKSVLTHRNSSFSLAEILLNEKKTIFLEHEYHTHAEYEISSDLTFVLDINSANCSMVFNGLEMKRFEVKYEIVES